MVCDKNLVIPKELFSKKYSRELQNEIWAVAKTLGATVFSMRTAHILLMTICH